MKILLVAKNAMGDVADYEIEVEAKKDIVVAINKLYNLPGIVLVKVHPEYVTAAHLLPGKV